MGMENVVRDFPRLPWSGHGVTVADCMHGGYHSYHSECVDVLWPAPAALFAANFSVLALSMEPYAMIPKDERRRPACFPLNATPSSHVMAFQRPSACQRRSYTNSSRVLTVALR